MAHHPTRAPEPKTDPNARGQKPPRRGSTGGGLATATAAGEPDPRPGWYTEWAARSILRFPKHTDLLARSLLSDSPQPGLPGDGFSGSALR